MGRAPARAPSPSYGGYSSQGGDTIRDLILQRGRVAAQGARDSGSFWANAIGGIGQVAGGYLAERSKRQEQEQVDEAIRAATTSQSVDPNDPEAGIADIVRGVPTDRRPEVSAAIDAGKVSRRDAAFMARMQDTENPVTPRDFVRAYGPVDGVKLAGAWEALQSDKPDAKAIVTGLRVASPALREAAWPATRAQIVRLPGMNPALVPEQWDGEFETRLMDEIDPPKAVDVPKAETRSLEIQAAEALTRGDQPAYDRLLRVKGQMGQADDRPQDPVARELALQRLADAKGKSGGGRSVTSGDANRLGEINTGLADLERLKGTLVGGVTGAASKVGTMLPDAVTEFTGWGAESKQTQANIDLVKQIIGKGLEGGVLRKEDEVKYAKILPKIGDPQEVVDGKLRGLVEALTRKRQDMLSALEDAGYDVSRFNARVEQGSNQRRVTDAASYAAVPSGQEYFDPQGNRRRKP